MLKDLKYKNILITLGRDNVNVRLKLCKVCIPEYGT